MKYTIQDPPATMKLLPFAEFSRTGSVILATEADRKERSCVEKKVPVVQLYPPVSPAADPSPPAWAPLKTGVDRVRNLAMSASRCDDESDFACDEVAAGLPHGDGLVGGINDKHVNGFSPKHAARRLDCALESV
jgi:hypothetical protein